MSSFLNIRPENALTTKVKVAGKRKGWSAAIARRSSPTTWKI